MKFSYRLIRDKTGFLAECVESEAVGEGNTAQDAVESLRASLRERMFRPDAVAPPSTPTGGVIELVLTDDGTTDEKRTQRLRGPCEAPPR